jgi:hypothetical protein
MVRRIFSGRGTSEVGVGVGVTEGDGTGLGEVHAASATTESPALDPIRNVRRFIAALAPLFS